jgi:hypothetical protein
VRLGGGRGGVPCSNRSWLKHIYLKGGGEGQRREGHKKDEISGKEAEKKRAQFELRCDKHLFRSTRVPLLLTSEAPSKLPKAVRVFRVLQSPLRAGPFGV